MVLLACKVPCHYRDKTLQYLGWRVNMEDAHIAKFDIENNGKTHVFGVFDGHGGMKGL